jgi:hypothetical protein
VIALLLVRHIASLPYDKTKANNNTSTKNKTERGCRGNRNMKRARSGVSAIYIEVREEGVVYIQT